MFASRYFAARYWADRYWPSGGDTVVEDTALPQGNLGFVHHIHKREVMVSRRNQLRAEILAIINPPEPETPEPDAEAPPVSREAPKIDAAFLSQIVENPQEFGEVLDRARQMLDLMSQIEQIERDILQDDEDAILVIMAAM